MGITTAVTLKVHPGTAPTTLLDFHQHNDLDSLPDFDDDNKVIAREYNAWVTRIKAMAQAQRLLSTLVGVAPDTAAIPHLTSVIHEAVIAASGIPKTKAGFANDLEQAFQTGVQSLTDGLTTSAALSTSHFFIQTEGLLSVPTSFITGTLLGLSSDGLFKTFPAGKFPPTAYVRAAGKAVFAAGGRVLADGVSTRFTTSGEIEVLPAGIDHGGLAGLGDAADHPYASLVDGTRPFTGEVAGVIPTVDASLATKGYVDGVVEGVDWKDSVRVATTAAGTLASDFENGDTIDGVVLATGNRILIKDQAAGTENGIYTVNASGAPTRTADYLSGSSAAFTVVPVEDGTANADRAFKCTNIVGSDVVGTDALVFAEFGGGEINTASNVGAGGVGVFKQKTLLDLEFKNINIGPNSTQITIADDVGDDEVDIDLTAGIEDVITWNLNGNVSTGAVQDSLRAMARSGTITAVIVTANQKGNTGVSLFDINLHSPTKPITTQRDNTAGVTMYTTQANRPDITGDNATSSQNAIKQATAPDIVAFVAGDFLSLGVDVSQATLQDVTICVYVRYDPI